MSKTIGGTSESVTVKTFLSWDFHDDFEYEADTQNKLTNLQCKICTQHTTKIRQEAKSRGMSGQSLQSIINYVDGVKYIHKSNVTRHVKSGSLHDWAKRKFCSDEKNTSSPSTSSSTASSVPSTQPLGLVQKLLLKGAKDQYKNHFVTALSIVAKERPLSDFGDLIGLQAKNGVKFVSGKNDKKTCREMISYLAMAMHQDIENILKNCSFFSCEEDGSEARKTRDEKELIYTKVLIRGEAIELLLKCQRMSSFGGVSASNVKEAIDDAFKSYLVTDEKYTKCLVSACADGAAVNFGHLQGALTVLKTERPWLILIHCSAHRIELAVKDAFKESSEFQEIDDMMLNLYLFFRNSGKCWRILLHVADKFGVTLQRFPKSAGTRFQVHKYRALKVLIVNFLPLCMFAENMIEGSKKVCDTKQKAKLRGYMNIWLSYQYLASLHFYRLVLKETAHLSYICQDTKHLVTDAIEVLQSASENLENIAEKDTELPFPVQEELDTDSVTITASSTNLPANQRFREKNELTMKQKAKAEKCITVVREQYQLKKVKQGKTAVKRMKEKLIPAIATHLNTRMESFNDDIFTAFKIADHAQWDHSDGNYGISDVKLIAEHFEESLKFHGFSLDLAIAEWKSLKNLVKNKFIHFKSKVVLWQQIFIHYQKQYPHILLIIELILITPYSSASVERGFSLMSRLLSNTRLNMSNNTLNDLMVLRVNLPVLCSCDAAYEQKLVDKAIDLYMSKSRRTSKKAKKRPASSSTDELRLESTQASTDTFLPVPVASLIGTNELSCDEEFLTGMFDDSDDSVAISDTDSSSDDDL